ncbi:unnamed protein product [Euphydryas editha]|uniref:Uncharacterized protein n=1 Tax=Euphydryas editha TaxID=104508 RepID=A0AAU9TUA2_EUPED|nr:unnamed protein product [Euphydryas editha]
MTFVLRAHSFVTMVTGTVPLFSSVLTASAIEFVKLAREGDREGVLVPLLPEPDDSGIDSDDTERARAQRDELVQGTESSSSDEDPIVKVPWVRCTKKGLDEQLKNMEEGRLHREVLIPMAQWQSRDDTQNEFNSPDRSSPPLYEVELTASDEDDDTSVLELVIPLQSKNVPKSTPKQLVEFITLLCTTCCFFF